MLVPGRHSYNWSTRETDHDTKTTMRLLRAKTMWATKVQRHFFKAAEPFDYSNCNQIGFDG